MTNKIIIKIRNLSFSYNSIPILDNISFNIIEGDFLAIIGPNGAGKTTLIKLIIGFLTPKLGSIEILDKKLNSKNMFKIRKDIGYVPQKFTFEKGFPALVKEILGIQNRDNLDKIVNYLNLNSIINKKFDDLSGGEQQKVLLAFSLLKDPKILILDEPTIGVDIKTQREFYKLLKKLNKQEKLTILVVTHDIGIIPNWAKNILCVNNNVCCFENTKNMDKIIENMYGGANMIHQHHIN